MSSDNQTKTLLVLCFVICFHGLNCLNQTNGPSPKGDKFSFASYYGDNMVLQGDPLKATIWGHAPNGSQYGLVNVVFYPKLFTYVASIKDDLTWSLTVGPFKSSEGAMTIEASLYNKKIVIKNVLFGDIWVCSGQSNMQFVMSQVFNATEELQDALNYPDIRIFELGLITSLVPLDDLHDNGIMVPWSIPTPDSLGGKPFTHFSAVCWLYGKYLYQKLQKPIGLIDTSWGGTPVEAWSSTDALRKCGLSDPDDIAATPHPPDLFDAPQNGSVIWNAMVNPMVKMTIYGVIWYQGENNAFHNRHLYNCTFPTMIDDWRKKFSTVGQSAKLFPFGFVQLAANQPSYIDDSGFAEIRWHQTADYGYVPNHRLRNVFMAVAMDLPDFMSPYGPIHPRDKQDVAARLALGGLALGYGYNTSYQGPYPVKVTINTAEPYNYTEIEIEYTMSLEERWLDGMEICCSLVSNAVCSPGKSWWLPISTVETYGQDNVTISYAPECDIDRIVGIRYAWRDSPCNFKKCALYGANNALPVPPFMYKDGGFQKIRISNNKYVVKFR